jgi:hypothetical protein
LRDVGCLIKVKIWRRRYYILFQLQRRWGRWMKQQMTTKERRGRFSVHIRVVEVFELNSVLDTYSVPLFSNSGSISTNNLSPLGPRRPLGNTFRCAGKSSACLANSEVGRGSVASVSGGCLSPTFLLTSGDLLSSPPPPSLPQLSLSSSSVSSLSSLLGPSAISYQSARTGIMVPPGKFRT